MPNFTANSFPADPAAAVNLRVANVIELMLLPISPTFATGGKKPLFWGLHRL
jgi:hypothetical protein